MRNKRNEAATPNTRVQLDARMELSARMRLRKPVLGEKPEIRYPEIAT